MIEGAMRQLTSIEGVQTVHLLEEDGFVVYSHGEDNVGGISGDFTRWQTLLQTTEKKSMITLVMEQGYLVFHMFGPQILVVKCTRNANLGALRATIRSVC